MMMTHNAPLTDDDDM